MTRPAPRRRSHARSVRGSSRTHAPVRLRLFVMGAQPASVKAVRDIRALCERRLKGRYSLEIVDMFQQPPLAKERVTTVPLLLKKLPGPARRVAGDFADEEHVLSALGLESGS
jgi:circadian clock protein KaiB